MFLILLQVSLVSLFLVFFIHPNGLAAGCRRLDFLARYLRSQVVDVRALPIIHDVFFNLCSRRFCGSSCSRFLYLLLLSACFRYDIYRFLGSLGNCFRLFLLLLGLLLLLFVFFDPYHHRLLLLFSDFLSSALFIIVGLDDALVNQSLSAAFSLLDGRLLLFADPLALFLQLFLPLSLLPLFGLLGLLLEALLLHSDSLFFLFLQPNRLLLFADSLLLFLL